MALQATPWERRAWQYVGAHRWPYRVVAVDSPSRPTRQSAYTMANHGIEIHPYADGASALLALVSEDPAAVVAPTDMEGVDLVRFVRAVTAWSDVPVIVGLTSGIESPKLAYTALECGARGLVGLPLTGEELGSAIRNIGLREPASAAPLAFGPVVIEREAHRVRVSGTEVHLTPRELLVLEHLVTEAPRLVPVTELGALIGDTGQTGPGKVRKIVEKIRRRLAEADPDREILKTVRGVGYRLLAVKDPDLPTPSNSGNHTLPGSGQLG